MAHVADRLDEQLDNLFRLPWTLYRSSQASPQALRPS